MELQVLMEMTFKLGCFFPLLKDRVYWKQVSACILGDEDNCNLKDAISLTKNMPFPPTVLSAAKMTPFGHHSDTKGHV